MLPYGGLWKWCTRKGQERLIILSILRTLTGIGYQEGILKMTIAGRQRGAVVEHDHENIISRYERRCR